MIPDSSIKLVPAGNASDIRPSSEGWQTNTTGNRIIYIDIGDDLDNGGEIKFVRSKNVKNYQVELFGKVKVSIIIGWCVFVKFCCVIQIAFRVHVYSLFTLNIHLWFL